MNENETNQGGLNRKQTVEQLKALLSPMVEKFEVDQDCELILEIEVVYDALFTLDNEGHNYVDGHSYLVKHKV